MYAVLPHHHLRHPPRPAPRAGAPLPPHRDPCPRRRRPPLQPPLFSNAEFGKLQPDAVLAALGFPAGTTPQLVQKIALPAAGASQHITIPRVPLFAGTNWIEFHVEEGCTRPKDISASTDTRCMSLGVSQIALFSP